MLKPINSVLVGIDNVITKFINDFDGVNFKDFIGTVLSLSDEQQGNMETDTVSE